MERMMSKHKFNGPNYVVELDVGHLGTIPRYPLRFLEHLPHTLGLWKPDFSSVSLQNWNFQNSGRLERSDRIFCDQLPWPLYYTCFSRSTKLYCLQNRLWKLMLANEACTSQEDYPSMLSTYNIAWAQKKIEKIDLLCKVPILAGALCSEFNASYGLDPQ